jgi:murein DD-endopeptidase MepM/ murein hydrolase activator NlpD
MAGRSWTVVVVPHGSAATRTLDISERTLRRIGWGLATAVLAGLLTFTVAAVRYSGSPVFAALMTPADRQLVDLRTRLAELRDTIVTIDKRDEQIRMLAGLPSADSEATTPASQLPLDVDRLIERANTLSASFATVSTTLSRNSERMSATPSIMPTTGWLSSEFSRARFHPILHLARPHEGIDLAAPYGTPVVAPAAGRVIGISHQTGYGLVLEIDHGNGIETKYAHLSRVVVQEGQHVTRGEPIAAVGNSGLSTGPHLHYEVHVSGKVVDPLTYVLPGAIPD